jgi:hypothetical protein
VLKLIVVFVTFASQSFHLKKVFCFSDCIEFQLLIFIPAEPIYNYKGRPLDYLWKKDDLREDTLKDPACSVQTPCSNFKRVIGEHPNQELVAFVSQVELASIAPEVMETDERCRQAHAHHQCECALLKKGNGL